MGWQYLHARGMRPAARRPPRLDNPGARSHGVHPPQRPFRVQGPGPAVHRERRSRTPCRPSRRSAPPAPPTRTSRPTICSASARACRRPSRATPRASIHYIDWKNPANNTYHCTAEFKVERIGHQKHYIPDIVLFVNGIPLVVIECKRSAYTDVKKKPIDLAIGATGRLPGRRTASPSSSSTPKSSWPWPRQGRVRHHRHAAQVLDVSGRRRGWMTRSVSAARPDPWTPSALKRDLLSGPFDACAAEIPGRAGPGARRVRAGPRCSMPCAGRNACWTSSTSSSSSTTAKRRSPATSSISRAGHPRARPLAAPRRRLRRARAAWSGTPRAAASP